MNWGLLLLFVVILGAIAASNVWLRRRSEAANEDERDLEPPAK